MWMMTHNTQLLFFFFSLKKKSVSSFFTHKNMYHHIVRTDCKPGDLRIRIGKKRKRNVLESLSDLIRMLKCKKTKVLVLSGAGISCSAGIPDFRSENGIYKMLDTEAMGLSQPEELFDIHFFEHNPVPFFTFAKSLLFGNEKEKNRFRRRRIVSFVVWKHRNSFKECTHRILTVWRIVLESNALCIVMVLLHTQRVCLANEKYIATSFEMRS